MKILVSDKVIEKINNIFKIDLNSEVISSLLVMLIILIFALLIFFKARKADPLKKPKGILLIAEMGVDTFDGLVDDMMGPHFNGFGGYIMAIALYLFLAFIFGLTGLPAPMTNLAVPLSLALCTFVLIHVTSAKYTGFKYFKRYIDPFPMFLPINLISMWAPLLSLSLRLFGNAIAGWVLMSIVYSALGELSSMIFSFIDSGVNSLFIAPIVTPILHAYFDLFSGFIQTTVFIFLTMIFIGQELPEDIDERKLKTEGGK